MRAMSGIVLGLVELCFVWGESWLRSESTSVALYGGTRPTLQELPALNAHRPGRMIQKTYQAEDASCIFGEAKEVPTYACHERTHRVH